MYCLTPVGDEYERAAPGGDMIRVHPMEGSKILLTWKWDWVQHRPKW